MELREALTQISQIRDRIARAEVFRGYRSLTVAFSGVLACVAAMVQELWIPRPLERLDLYLSVWICAAAIGVAVTGIEVWLRTRATESLLARRLTVLAVEQFLPCIAAGAVLTLAIGINGPDTAWLLPGVWSVLFSLGVFASYRLLPRPVCFVGFYYLFGGILALGWGRGAAALSPWSMGLIFGGGQLLTAAILYLTLEREGQNGEPE